MSFIENLKNNNWGKQEHRQKSVLSYLWSYGAVSRRELMERMDISAVSVTSCVNKMIDAGIIREKSKSRRMPKPNKQGRQPTRLCLNEKLFYSIGIRFHKGCEVVLLNAQTKVVASIFLEEEQFNGISWQQKCDIMISNMKILLKDNNINSKDIIGIGITLTGIIKPKTGVVVSSGVFKPEKHVPLGDYITSKMGITCSLMNMSHLFALLEHRWGKARNMDSFFSVYNTSGLGFFMNGQLFRGSQYCAGELEYMQLYKDGKPGLDGRRGTLGQCSALRNITEFLDQLRLKNENIGMEKYIGDSKYITLAMVIDAIEDGHQLCAQLMSDSFEDLGRVLLNLVYALNPEAIFLMPWTTRIPKVTLDVVKRYIDCYNNAGWEVDTQVLSASFNLDDYARGAGLLPGEFILSNTNEISL